MCLIVRQSQKAIVNRLREVYHRPASVPLTESGAFFQLEVALLKDHAMITLDTTGPSLFKRGYRLEKGRTLKRKYGCSISHVDQLAQRPTVC